MSDGPPRVAGGAALIAADVNWKGNVNSIDVAAVPSD